MDVACDVEGMRERAGLRGGRGRGVGGERVLYSRAINPSFQINSRSLSLPPSLPPFLSRSLARALSLSLACSLARSLALCLCVCLSVRLFHVRYPFPSKERRLITEMG